MLQKTKEKIQPEMKLIISSVRRWIKANQDTNVSFIAVFEAFDKVEARRLFAYGSKQQLLTHLADLTGQIEQADDFVNW